MYRIWNNVQGEVEAEGLTLEEAQRTIEGAVENLPDYDREDLEIQEEED